MLIVRMPPGQTSRSSTRLTDGSNPLGSLLDCLPTHETPGHSRRYFVCARLVAYLAALLLSWPLFAPPALARESCPFLRDPAFYARTPVPPATEGTLAIGTLNAYRLFDDEQDGDESLVLGSREFATRVSRMARYIVRDMGAPAVIGLQEVEDATVVQALATELQRQTGRPWKGVIGEVAGDGDIRNALLAAQPLRVLAVSSLFGRSPREGRPLHDRLPLVVDVDAGSHGILTFVVLHKKSLLGTDRAGDAERVFAKRQYQARELAGWIREQPAGRRLVVLGDLNAPVTGRDDRRGEPLHVLLDEGGLADPAGSFLKPSQRWTYRFRCLLQQLDHVLVSPALLPRVSGYAISRGDTCIRAREKCDVRKSVSDHDAVVIRLRSR